MDGCTVRVHGTIVRTPRLERAVAEVIKILREAERKEQENGGQN